MCKKVKNRQHVKHVFEQGCLNIKIKRIKRIHHLRLLIHYVMFNVHVMLDLKYSLILFKPVNFLNVASTFCIYPKPPQFLDLVLQLSWKTEPKQASRPLARSWARQSGNISNWSTPAMSFSGTLILFHPPIHTVYIPFPNAPLYVGTASVHFCMCAIMHKYPPPWQHFDLFTIVGPQQELLEVSLDVTSTSYLLLLLMCLVNASLNDLINHISLYASLIWEPL